MINDEDWDANKNRYSKLKLLRTRTRIFFDLQTFPEIMELEPRVSNFTLSTKLIRRLLLQYYPRQPLHRHHDLLQENSYPRAMRECCYSLRPAAVVGPKKVRRRTLLLPSFR